MKRDHPQRDALAPSVEFISTLRPKRPDVLATMTPDEQAVLGEHMACTKRLFHENKIVMGGAATDGTIGIIVWRVDSAEEMQRLYDKYPAEKAGIGYPGLHQFRIGLLAGR